MICPDCHGTGRDEAKTQARAKNDADFAHRVKHHGTYIGCWTCNGNGLEPPYPDSRRRAYSVHVFWQDGRERIPFETDDSTAVTAYAKNNIAHDPRVIRRIEVHDLSGCVETVWDASWT